MRMSFRNWFSFILIAGSVFYFQNSFSQGIKFENGNWQQVLKKAKRQDKNIFLQLYSSSCEQCNEVADKAFGSETLGDYFNQRFISVRIDGTSGEGRVLADKFSVSAFPVSLYLKENEEVLYRYNGSTSNPTAYMRYADIASSRTDEIPLNTYDKEYKEGNRGLLFLESYISERKEMNMPVDSLLEQYAAALPKDSLHSFRVINFIFEQAPVVTSKAFAAMNADPYILHQVYKSATANKSAGINNSIILKTRRKAIEERNDALALRAANFAKDTWGNNRINGQKGFDLNMLEFYKGTKDTTRFIKAAKDYYNGYYMSKNLDSLKKAEEEAFKTVMKSIPGDTIKTGPRIVMRKTVIVSSSNFEYGNSLNSGAWSMYQFASGKNDLENALSWVKRAIDYHEDPAYFDTYAHLLYRLNNKDEAIIREQKAVDIINQKRHGVGIRGYENELNKMKSNSL
jgi:thiol-disulfide isomerase/thioredoxin